MMKNAIKAAAIQPIAQKLSNSTTARPLSLAGILSETKVEATGNSPPSPKPATKRSTQSIPNPVANADNPLAAEKISNVHSSIGLRLQYYF